MTYRPSIAERIAWTSGQLGAATVKVLVALWSCGDYETGRNCQMYLSTLVKRSGVSLATVKRVLRDLKLPTQPGGPWIIASRRHRHATRYDIVIDRLATAPPKEQQMTMQTLAALTRFEAQIEPQIPLEAQNEPLGTKSEAQIEPPTSDPDLVPEERTHTPRAREETLPLVGQTPPPRCAHPHAHAWCEGRVHVPRDLHFEFLDRLDTRPGESAAAKAGRLVAFYADTMAQLPATEAVGDPYKFWKVKFAAWVQVEASRPSIVEREPAAAAYDAVWRQILARIETKVNRHTFYTWFRPLVMVTDHPTATGRVIEVTKNGPDGQLFVDWVTKHYTAVVQAAVDEVRPGSRVVLIDAWALDSAAADAADRKAN